MFQAQTINNFTENDAAFARNILAEASLQRKQDIVTFCVVRDQDTSDDEADSECPYFDQLYSRGGASAVKYLNNFTTLQFEQLWLVLFNFVGKNNNCCRGKIQCYWKRYPVYVDGCAGIWRSVVCSVTCLKDKGTHF